MTDIIPLATDYEKSTATRTAVNRLDELLEWLYPDPSPDIFTLRDFLNRYPLTGLGELATEAIERSQRIVRALGDYGQAGLCEFHVGLIYLYWGDFRGAIRQFDTARQQWSFVSQPAAMALAYLACGYAQEMAFHYEPAMICLGKALNWLERVRFGSVFAGQAQFKETVAVYATAAQKRVRSRMNKPEPTAKGAEETEDDATEAPVEAEPETAVPAPSSTAEDASTIPEQPEPSPEPAPTATGDTPPPIVNLQPDAALEPMPIPGHARQDARYGWYQVAERETDDAFLPNIEMGDWLLVYMQPEEDDPLLYSQPIMVMIDEEIEGSIVMKPHQAQRPYQRIYLAKLTEPVGAFARDPETGTVTFSSQMEQISVNWSEILGVVIGFWRPVAVR